jgi:hypothetical protein
MLGGFGTSPLELLAADAMLRGEIWCENFSYSATWETGTTTALAANSTTITTIATDSGPDFIVQEINFVAWSAANTIIASPDYTLLLVIDGSGKQIMNQAQPITALAGGYASGVVPARLPFPRLIQSNSKVTFTLTNRTAVANNRADIVLRGFKVYYVSGTRTGVFHVV